MELRSKKMSLRREHIAVVSAVLLTTIALFGEVLFNGEMFVFSRCGSFLLSVTATCSAGVGRFADGMASTAVERGRGDRSTVGGRSHRGFVLSR